MKQYNIPREKLVIMTKCHFGVNEDRDATFQPLVSRRDSEASEFTFLPADGEVLTTLILFFPNRRSGYANTTGLSRTAIFNQVNASLKRLNTDYIDLLWSEIR